MVAGSRKKALSVTPKPRMSSVRKRVVAFLSMTVLESIGVSVTSTVTYSVGGWGVEQLGGALLELASTCSKLMEEYISMVFSLLQVALTVVGFPSSLHGMYGGQTPSDMVRYN